MSSGVYRINRRTFTSGLGGVSLLAACGRQPKISKAADVIVVGAGLSGLFAAHWLQKEGYKVKVLEGSSRIGGRLLTLYDVPGQPEAGGSQVGQSYARMRYAAQQVNVNILDETTQQSADQLICVGDAQSLKSAWAGAASNPFPAPFKPTSPEATLFAAAARANTFDWPGAWRTQEAFAKDVSARRFLAEQGFSEEALRLINSAVNANNIDSYSMLNVWRTLQLFMQERAAGPIGFVEGGSQKLPEAMAEAIGDVDTDFEVRRVESNDLGVTVSGDKGAFQADYCVLALPFPAINKIALAPAPQGVQAKAFQMLPYTQIMQLHLLPETPFWESDGLPARMWTDGPIERVFENKDRASGETVGLIAWINGDSASDLAGLNDAELENLAQTEFARLRPASGGKIRLLKAVRWMKGHSYAGGAYMHWAPGQAAQWAENMGAPLGRIHFAGEHLSYLHTGMEGAMEAGQNAAEAIIAASNG